MSNYDERTNEICKVALEEISASGKVGDLAPDTCRLYQKFEGDGYVIHGNMNGPDAVDYILNVALDKVENGKLTFEQYQGLNALLLNDPNNPDAKGLVDSVLDSKVLESEDKEGFIEIVNTYVSESGIYRV